MKILNQIGEDKNVQSNKLMRIFGFIVMVDIFCVLF